MARRIRLCWAGAGDIDGEIICGLLASDEDPPGPFLIFDRGHLAHRVIVLVSDSHLVVCISVWDAVEIDSRHHN